MLHVRRDIEVLAEALKKTFANRGHKYTVEQFEQIMTFDADVGMQKKWWAFTKKTGAETVDFRSVLETIRTFLIEPYRLALE